MKIGVLGRNGGEESANSKIVCSINLLLINSKNPTSIFEIKFNSG